MKHLWRPLPNTIILFVSQRREKPLEIFQFELNSWSKLLELIRLLYINAAKNKNPTPPRFIICLQLHSLDSLGLEVQRRGPCGRPLLLRLSAVWALRLGPTTTTRPGRWGDAHGRAIALAAPGLTELMRSWQGNSHVSPGGRKEGEKWGGGLPPRNIHSFPTRAGLPCTVTWEHTHGSIFMLFSLLLSLHLFTNIPIVFIYLPLLHS